jgi:DNA-binding response OmpR family regulator
VLGGEWFAVVGILDPVPLAPELDSAALVGWPAAGTYLRFDGNPTTVYARSVESQVLSVRAVLAPTANPAVPDQVLVSRPSDVLAAKQATDGTLTALLLGLGAVALLVGGRVVPLTAREFAVLEVLAGEPGRVFGRQQIIDRAFGFDHDVLERTVDAHVMNLRRKLGTDPTAPGHPETVYRPGYRLTDGT